MEQHGNKTTYNVETVLRKNVVDSEYWRNTCAKLQTFDEIVDQIFYDVTHVEPWMSGNARGASSAFGLLYRLCQVQPTEEQVESLLTHEDSPYIRAVGFLYLRYVGDPKQLWGWLRPYVRDTEELWPSGENGSAVTMGDYVRDVFLEQYYFETIFPRIPKPVNDEWMGNLRSMGLPAKAVGNGGQGGPDRRGLDEPNRRPASVKASLSVAFGQRAPNRATAREEGRGLGAGMKNVYNGTREERPQSSSRDTRTVTGRAPVEAAPKAVREEVHSRKRDREGQQPRSRDSAHERDSRSHRDYTSQHHSGRHGERDKQHSSRDGSHKGRERERRRSSRDTAYRESKHRDRPHSSRHETRRQRSRSPNTSSRHRQVFANGSALEAPAPKLHRLAAAYDVSPARGSNRREPDKLGAEEVYYVGGSRR